MRLLTTGAFVRATRSTRLHAPHRSRPLVQHRTTDPGSRWQSHQVTAERAPESFPEQSVNIKREVDPRKTAAQSTQQEALGSEQDAKTASFLQELRDQKRKNEIIHKDGKAGAKISGIPYVFDSTSNVTSSILNLVDRNLYSSPNHPVSITRKLIESVFNAPEFHHHIAPNPVVTTYDNFEVLGFPKDHPGRSRTDTYYVDSSHVLRTHTSAHQHIAFRHMAKHNGLGYTICADVYRRDSIDRSHFPVFHQMEGARLWRLTPNPERRETRYTTQKRRTAKMQQDIDALPKHNLLVEDQAGAFDRDKNPPQAEHDEADVDLMGQHLKRSLETLINVIFTAAKAADVGDPSEKDKQLQVRWIEAYFPFTSPSWELEVFWQGEWLEILGCGVVQQPILNGAGLKDRIGWAWGIGIERLAMILFGIPDIRLFWSTDKRFLDQFQAGRVNKFEPFSKYPDCYKDIAFWIEAAPAAASPVGAESASGAAVAAGGDATKASPTETQPAAFHENDVMEIVRDVAGRLAEDVKLVDEFVHPRSGRKSLCYRISYRSLERTLTNEEVNKMHTEVSARLAAELPIELR